jgi:UDP-MurNAc hydroxylase
MKFTVIGHSCLRIETSGPTILVDPWLFGSCYWRSWWHYPTVAEPTADVFAPDFVYLTHHHFDHFHFPSVRKIDRAAQVLVPKFGVPTLAEEVRNLGFDDVMEMPHGQVVQLAPGVRAASYQFGADDSVFVVADGEHVLVDVNDSKIRGQTIERILAEFGRPTFVLKSYSFAQSYPVLYTADDPADLELVTRETYLDNWISVVDTFNPEYGVPFGSMVAFLHPESRPANEHLITPSEVVSTFEKEHPRSDTAAVQMDPGDSWSSETGFHRAECDWYADRAGHLDELAAQVAPKLADQDEKERGVALDFAIFADYFTSFMRALPRGLLGRVVLRRPVVFEVASSPLPYWVLDFSRRAVYRLSAPPPETASIVTVNEAVLADAIEKRLVHVVHGSMRIRVHLRPGGVADDLMFWGLIVPWELGYLPVRRSLSLRLAEVAWRRRAEGFEWGSAARSGGKNLSDHVFG